MPQWELESVHVSLDELGEQYSRYRLGSPCNERAMLRSLERYGQLTPLAVCRRESGYELLDGFKRCLAAGELGWSRLQIRCLEVNEREAKAAIYSLNHIGGRTHELEEAWIVYALVREDGMSQVDVADLLGRHKSWVCRRLALVERLGAEAKEDLRLGLLSPSQAREVVRLPAGNQAEVVELVRREALTRDELQGVTDLLLGCTNEAQHDFVLERPREALEQARGAVHPSPHDPRLSPVGNRSAKRLGILLEQLARMAGWLGTGAHGELTPRDRELLEPSMRQLAECASAVAELARDFIAPSQACR